jgi:hypothetical protein
VSNTVSADLLNLGLFGGRRSARKQARNYEKYANDDERMDGCESDLDREPKHEPCEDEQDSENVQNSHVISLLWLGL